MGILINRTVYAECKNVTDDKQTDDATEKCVTIGGIASAATAIRHTQQEHKLTYELAVCIDKRTI